MKKLLTILYRLFTTRCIYCGNKKEQYSPFGGDLQCPTNRDGDSWANRFTGCSYKKIFIKHKEARVQRALGLLSGPKGF